MNFTTITCTGDRPEAFALCEKYLEEQTLRPSQMLVLDDGHEPAKCTIGQEHYYLPHCRGPGSMVNKMKAALASGIVTGDAIAFIEDDDVFAPTWLAWCAEKLAHHELIGEGWSIYFNAHYRWWFQHNNTSHASLCASAIRRSAFDVLLQQCVTPENPFLDVRLWNALRKRSKVFVPGANPQVVGIKEMPGRKGYCASHTVRDASAKDDPVLRKLTYFIGERAKAYEPFVSPTPYKPPSDNPPPKPRPVIDGDFIRSRTGLGRRISAARAQTHVIAPLPPPPPMLVEAHTETGRTHGPNWMRWLDRLTHYPDVCGLEIGTFRGDSAEFMCENIVTGPGARYFCVDPFTGSPEHEAGGIDCSTNEAFARKRLEPFGQCEIITGRSEEFLRTFSEKLDFAYVDGHHASMNTLRDAVLVFDLLKVGGILIFDDYAWTGMPRPIDCPKIGIDAFRTAYADQVELLSPVGWQIAFRKIKET